MKRISSKYLFLTKRVFPALWFGILAFVVILMIRDGVWEKAPFAVVVPCVIAIFGYFLMKKLVWDLADEVYDCGDFLLVRNRGEEERVPFTDIMNVSASFLVNPPRVTLRLAKPGKFGDEVSFSPVRPWLINPFSRNRMVEDLIVRVDTARAKRISH